MANEEKLRRFTSEITRVFYAPQRKASPMTESQPQ
jgi:hypothetical protein